MKIGFLASGNGSNMQAIIDACKSGSLKARPVLVISNNSQSGAIERAKKENIPYSHISGKTHPLPDKAIADALSDHSVDIVVLAGYMKKVGSELLSRYKGAILNIHPALLPKFGGDGMYGIRVHQAVLAAGEKESGVSIHIVDENYDTGPVIAQVRAPVEPDDTPESLAARVLEQEHLLFPKTLEKIATGEIKIPGYGLK
ncbi:MAG: phosphoribosylglycinamide formyltransferase [Candidatus Portnoybacteria bacterium]